MICDNHVHLQLTLNGRNERKKNVEIVREGEEDMNAKSVANVEFLVICIYN